MSTLFSSLQTYHSFIIISLRVQYVEPMPISYHLLFSLISLYSLSCRLRRYTFSSSRSTLIHYLGAFLLLSNIWSNYLIRRWLGRPPVLLQGTMKIPPCAVQQCMSSNIWLPLHYLAMAWSGSHAYSLTKQTCDCFKWWSWSWYFTSSTK